MLGGMKYLMISVRQAEEVIGFSTEESWYMKRVRIWRYMGPVGTKQISIDFA